MRDDHQSGEEEFLMEDPVSRLLNGVEAQGDEWPRIVGGNSEQPNILTIIGIGVIPPLFLFAISYFF